ncbi:phage tail fiber assembly protein [Escherichia coli]|nr:phage tail fiber assembly protein [Escherichia coli]
MFLEDGAVYCEVLLEGQEVHLPYTAVENDVAEMGKQVWQELQSGKWGGIARFTVTPELIAAEKEAKVREIEVWRQEQESMSFMLEWKGHKWNAGPVSLSRLLPVVMAAKSGAGRETIVWGDGENTPILLTMQELEELAAVMARAQADRNDEIYRRQREMKEDLNNLDDLGSIRAFGIG